MRTEVRFRIFKDPESSRTHFIGFWLALAAAIALVCRVADAGTQATGMAIDGVSPITLFLAFSL